jgi:hypothetical protein
LPADAVAQGLAMNRRTLICALGSLVAILSAAAYAQPSRSSPFPWAPWKDIPAIAIISAEDDYRLAAVREAVDFWNAELSKLGSPFRLGHVAHVVETDPPGGPPYLRDPLAGNTLSRLAKTLSRMAPAGDVIVALSNESDFRAFTSATPDLQKVIVPIPDLRAYMRMLPGLARNVVAHELGHVIGLGHNVDAMTLMCGKPWCARLDIPNEGFLPITESEKTKLLEMYPPNWQPQPFRKWITDPPYSPGQRARTLGGFIVESASADLGLIHGLSPATHPIQ